jgi:hypothetical protein
LGIVRQKGSKRRNASLAGGPFFDVVYIMTTMIEVGSVIAVGYEDVNKTMIEVG